MMGLSDEERGRWEEVKEWLDGHFEVIGFWRKQEQLAHDRGKRIKELEGEVTHLLGNNLSLEKRLNYYQSALCLPGGKLWAVHGANEPVTAIEPKLVTNILEENTRLREAVEWALESNQRVYGIDEWIKELRRRAGKEG